MKCLKCFTELTQINRQIADRDLVIAGITVARTSGRPLPYCKSCVRQHKVRAALKSLDSLARAKYVIDRHKELLSKAPYEPEDVEEARRDLEESGFTALEITVLLEGLVKK